MTTQEIQWLDNGHFFTETLRGFYSRGMWLIVAREVIPWRSSDADVLAAIPHLMNEGVRARDTRLGAAVALAVLVAKARR